MSGKELVGLLLRGSSWPGHRARAFLHRRGRAGDPDRGRAITFRGDLRITGVADRAGLAGRGQIELRDPELNAR